MDSQAIATQAEKLHKGKGSTLRTEQVATLLQLRKIGKTQVEIAQTLGCDQGTVSRWLTKLTDTTELAGSYLRGSALRMAKHVVNKGQARDHIMALKGIGVLEADRSDIKVAIGISLPGMAFASESSAVTEVIHSVSGDLGSDKVDSVNQD